MEMLRSKGYLAVPPHKEGNAMALAIEKKKKGFITNLPEKRQETRLNSVSPTKGFWVIFKERSGRSYAYPIELYYFSIMRAYCTDARGLQLFSCPPTPLLTQ